MTGAEILFAADAALTLWIRAKKEMAKAKQDGLITAEQQQERLDRVDRLEDRVGLPPEDGG